MRTTANIIVSTFTKFARRGEYARGEHYIECIVDEQLSLESGELVAHGKAHLCTGELPDDISYDFYKSLTVTIQYSKEKGKWVATTAWAEEWLDELNQPMPKDVEEIVCAAYGLALGEDKAIDDFAREAQDVADNMEFVLYVNGLTGAEKLAFVNGWSLEGGPVDNLGTEWANCTPWAFQDAIYVSAFELDFLPRTAEEWGRAYWLEKKSEIVYKRAMWYKGASEIERAMWRKEHPLIAESVERLSNDL
jgi:hypothetical protein